MSENNAKKPLTVATQPFPTLAVAGVYTGFILESFPGLHQVMDYLYPGIMTMGTAVMQPAASKHLGESFPKLVELGIPEKNGDENFGVVLKLYMKRVVDEFGPTMDVPFIGIIDDDEINEEFVKFGMGKSTANHG